MRDAKKLLAGTGMPALKKVNDLLGRGFPSGYGYISQKQGWEIGVASDYDPENTRVVHIDQLTKYEG